MSHRQILPTASRVSLDETVIPILVVVSSSGLSSYPISYSTVTEVS